MHTSWIPGSREARGEVYFFSIPTRQSKKSEEIQANNVEQTVADQIEDDMTIPDQLSEPRLARDAVPRSENQSMRLYIIRRPGIADDKQFASLKFLVAAFRLR